MARLINLAPPFAAITHTHSHLLLSGILLEQIDFIKETYQPWFTLAEFARKDEWVCLKTSPALMANREPFSGMDQKFSFSVNPT
ncbi:MAG: hypothetical protein ACD_45C00476G0005 [uncultured bacterium]|nr:MAG: hypothetical protein ACD_45C00476G0005 [uncultured bacterium]